MEKNEDFTFFPKCSHVRGLFLFKLSRFIKKVVNSRRYSAGAIKIDANSRKPVAGKENVNERRPSGHSSAARSGNRQEVTLLPETVEH